MALSKSQDLPSIPAIMANYKECHVHADTKIYSFIKPPRWETCPLQCMPSYRPLVARTNWLSLVLLAIDLNCCEICCITAHPELLSTLNSVVLPRIPTCCTSTPIRNSWTIRQWDQLWTLWITSSVYLIWCITHWAIVIHLSCLSLHVKSVRCQWHSQVYCNFESVV